MPPIIGITCSRIVGGAWGQFATTQFMDYQFDDYSRAVQHFGGSPIIIPVAQNETTLKAIVDRIDGIILSGGPDVHPRRYDEQPVEGMGEVEEDLDTMEIEVAKLAFQKQIPLLAICRGIQVLNVALGGTLYQDIPTQIQDSLQHSQNAAKKVLNHLVRIEKGSVLQRVIKKRKIWVNSKHHQAIKVAASPLQIVASAPDGVIEAVEDPNRPFVMGVQWHPEGTWGNDLYSKRLFRAFIQSANRPAPPG